MQSCDGMESASQCKSVHVKADALQGTATALSDSIDRNTPAKVPERCSEAPSVAGVERTLAMAHRLSYTSFAPPGTCLPFDLDIISAVHQQTGPARTQFIAGCQPCILR